MGSRKKWNLAARSPFATIRGRLGPRRKGVEGLCVSSLLGVLRSHTWLIGEEDVAFLLARTSLPRYQHHRTHSLSFSFCYSSADGGSEDLADPRSPSLDPHLSHVGQGGSIDSDCAFEGDYGVPPLSMTEGMQHIRIMEGVSRSLPSSPLLTHQTISVRLQPVKKLTAPLRKAKFVESPRIPQSELGSPTHTSTTAKNPDLDTYCRGKFLASSSLISLCYFLHVVSCPVNAVE
uniref:Protein TANC1 n=1 Tax=Dicentrarchus labrax TaxID=13489 RepID=E6ZHW9_DICLA|nr:Protein TANC1 [Dicentrarchus labrax]